jgi:small conductance mechanosensitive channel
MIKAVRRGWKAWLVIGATAFGAAVVTASCEDSSGSDIICGAGGMGGRVSPGTGGSAAGGTTGGTGGDTAGGTGGAN